MNKTYKIIYWVATTLVCFTMLYSASMYFLNYEMVTGFFEVLGYPTYIVYPLAVLKVLGVIAIVSRKSDWLKEWAYAGFFFDFVLAAAAHLSVNDGSHIAPIVASVFLFVSYFMEKKVFSKN